ncbi:MAG: glycosyltransferase [Muribaculaceae bacterium]|nr:glycosyltransferase [Muribaculaceae bacterium]
MKFLMISRVLYDKGYSQYIEAAKKIKEKQPEHDFILIGEIDTANKNHVPETIVKQDIESGYIKYLGYQTNVKEILKEIDCVVHPTYYNEGLSRVLMEALALRKPIITTDIPGCRETVIEGLNGFLCIPNNTESLVNKIEKFLLLSNQERIEMGKQGRLLAEKKFDINKVLTVYDNIIKNI